MTDSEKIYTGNILNDAGEPEVGYIEECVRRDTHDITADKDFKYDLSEAYIFLRNLHRDRIDQYLRKAKNTSYAEYLVTHGILPEKDHAYWFELLLQYLKANHIACENGTRIEIKDSFEYNSAMRSLWVSASLYRGLEPVKEGDLAGVFTDALTLRPVYHEDRKSFDVTLYSGDTELGDLNRICFRSTGLGVYLAQVLLSGSGTVRNISVITGDSIRVMFDLYCS